jgi:hypothetical protein
MALASAAALSDATWASIIAFSAAALAATSAQDRTGGTTFLTLRVQSNFFPTNLQINVCFAKVVVADFFLHIWPEGDFAAAKTGVNCNKESKRTNAKLCFLKFDTSTPKIRFIMKP